MKLARLNLFFINAAVLVSLFSCTNAPNNSGSLRKEEGGFEFLDPKSLGIDFQNNLKEDPNFNFLTFHYIYNGAGIAAGDINNDGLTDLYFTGNMVPDKLYLNKGDFKFEDISDKAGINKMNHGWHTGVLMADVNGDGYLDIYVCRGASLEPVSDRANLLFINQKDGTFSELAQQYGIADTSFSLMANFFDMDNDHDLDLIVSDRPDVFGIKIDGVVKGRKQAPYIARSKLFRNNGNLTFTDVTKEMGFGESFSYGLAVTTSDLNGDGFQDIYFANDFNENDYCYLNQGGKSFKESIREITHHTSFYSMGTDIMDINGDCLEDIMTVEMLPEDYWRNKVSMAPMVRGEIFDLFFTSGNSNLQYMQNVVNINRGNGWFSDIADLSGMKSTDWSWAVLASDYDNDGMRDVFITNGYKRDVFDNDAIKKADSQFKDYIKSHDASKPVPADMNLLKYYPTVKLVNYIYHNDGNFKFTNKIQSWGLNKESLSQGAVTADLDNDGDLDLVVNNLDEPPFIQRNNFIGNNSIRLKLKGPGQNTFGLGAKVCIKVKDQLQFEQFKTVRGYASSVEPIMHFGIGKEIVADEIKVDWNDGTETITNNIETGKVIEISYKNATPKPAPPPIVKPLFSDATSSIVPAFVHKENVFNDFQIQVLLPHRLSMNGPALCVGDVNGDGLEDFFVGGAKDQSGAIYIQTKDEKFILLTSPVLIKDKSHEDVGALFFDCDGDKDLDLYVVSGGTEEPANYSYYNNRLYINNGKGIFTKGNLPPIGISGMCVKTIDYDSDGDLDIFVGGRIIPNYYPYPSNSFLLRNDNGVFKDVTAEVAQVLNKIGLVTDAVVTDLNNDNKPDLILVGEWMPVTFLIQQNGKFVKDTSTYKIDGPNIGWWNRIVEADINGDGQKDYILGNLGLNYKFHASVEKPFEVFANDFDGNTTYDVFLAKHLKDKLVPIRGRQCSSEQLPNIIEKFPTFRDFAESDITHILGDKLDKAINLKANNFASVTMIRKGNNFHLENLPMEAQFAPIKGILYKDFNHDGKTDLFIAGNWFASEYETPVADNSIGLLMEGNDSTNFKTIPSVQSGIFLPQDVRDICLIKLGEQARTGILVAINNGTLKLLK
ncbi:MAG: FG-GAP-like repeat-containing protein [Saprospiraceae bacterium]